MRQTQIYKLDRSDFRTYSSIKKEVQEPSNPFDPSYVRDKKEELKCLMSRFINESSH
jgi:hypothetical protein